MVNFDAPLTVHFSPGDTGWRDLLQRIAGAKGLKILKRPEGAEGYCTVLHSGMTFNIWLHPAAARNAPDFSGYRQLFCNIDSAVYAAVEIGAGQHIADGRHLVPVVRCQLQLARILANCLDAVALGWAPATNLIDAAYFDNMVAEFLNDGPFPVFGMVDLRSASAGQYQTAGLAYFTGCEIVMTGPENLRTADGMKRLVRLCHDFIINGPVMQELEVDGYAPGEIICISPAKPPDRIVRVKIVPAPR